MARKDDAARKASAAKPAAGAEDLAILLPDGEATIAGQRITVREYGFVEGLQIIGEHGAFLDDLSALLSSGEVAPSFDDVLAVLARHVDALVALLAKATGCDEAWIRALGENDGDLLVLTWWQVNSGFFVRRAVRRALQARLAGSPSDGRASTTR